MTVPWADVMSVSKCNISKALTRASAPGREVEGPKHNQGRKPLRAYIILMHFLKSHANEVQTSTL